MNQREMRSEFENVAKKWLNDNWRNVVRVEIDKQTWEPKDSPTWDWHEALEYGVTPERHAVAYPEGISWEAEDQTIEIELDEQAFKAGERAEYEKWYDNNTDGELEVEEDWSNAQTVWNKQSITLDQKVSFGSELTTKAGFNIKAVEVGVEAKSTMSMELGASQNFTKEVKEEVSYGHAITFKVPARRKYKVQYIFDKGERTVDIEIKVRASGWVYVTAQYKDRPTMSGHVYPWKIFGKGPQGLGKPMPDRVRTFLISGKYTHTRYRGGRFIITDETESNITNQVQVATAP